jgi:hypothetical protein
VWSGFWGEEVPYAGHIPAKIVDCALPLEYLALALVPFRYSDSETFKTAGRCGGYVRGGCFVAHTPAPHLCVSVPIAAVLAIPAQDLCDYVGFFSRFTG